MGRMVSSIALPTAATSMALIYGFCQPGIRKGEVAVELKHEIPTTTTWRSQKSSELHVILDR